MKAPRFEARDLWGADGHLSDLVLAALADGQDSLVPDSARSHVESCGHCAERLGRAALLSTELGAALRDEAALRAPSQPAPTSFRLPALALAAAFMLALLGSVPRLLEFGRSLGEAPESWVETGLMALKGGALLFRGASGQDTPAVALAWCACALAILALGAIVARLAPPGSLERNSHASHDS